MDKQKILVLGSTGLVGSRFVELNKDKFQIKTAGRTSCDIELDISNPEQIKKAISDSDAEIVVNFAAFANVDESEKEKDNINGDIYKLNVTAPFLISEACMENNKKLYHISTDYVFEGIQNDQPYKETDIPNPTSSWYAKTKYEGELKVQEVSGEKNLFTIVRISFPYSGQYKRKLDIARAIIDRLKQGKEYFGITDQKIKPTSTEDIANAISFLINKNSNGIYHVAGHYDKSYISPLEFATKIAEKFNLDKSFIKPTTFLEYYRDKIAKRPRNTWMDTTKIESLGMKFMTEEGSLENFKKVYLLS